MMRMLTLLLLLGVADAGLAAGPATGVDRRAAALWLNDFTAALRGHDLAHVSTLLDEPMPVTVELMEKNAAPLTFTLTRAEYLQQLRALWRSAATRYDVGTASYSTDNNSSDTHTGQLIVNVELAERWQLFGTDTGQHNRLQVRLARRDGTIRAVAIHTVTTPQAAP